MAAKPGIGRKGARDLSGAAGEVQTFRSPTALVIWVVWLLFAVGNWIDLAVQGRDHASAVAAAILLLATGIAYVTAQRPRIIADRDGVTVRNPVRDHRIGWAAVAKVDLLDLLRLHCEWGAPTDQQGKHTKIISAWAVHHSRRRQFVAEAKARRGARRRGGFGMPFGDVPASEKPREAEAETIAHLLNERATAAQAEAIWARDTVEIAGNAGTGGTGEVSEAQANPAQVREVTSPSGWAGPPVSTWSVRAIAALVIPALILLIVWLV